MRHLIKKILRESDFDWVEDINPIFTEDSVIIFDKIPTMAEWDGLLKFVEDEIGNHTFGMYNYRLMLQSMRDDEGFVIYVEPKKHFVLSHSDYRYYLTDEIDNFVRYELSKVLEQLIKDYMRIYGLNESTNDFDWVGDIEEPFKSNTTVVFKSVPKKEDWDRFLDFMFEEFGTHSFNNDDYRNLVDSFNLDEDDVGYGYVIYVEPKARYGVLSYSPYEWYRENENGKYIEYSFDEVMNIIRVNVNESTNDFDWVGDVDDSHGWFERYKENPNEFTHLLNFANKYYKEFYGGEQDFFTKIGSYICEKGTLPEFDNYCTGGGGLGNRSLSFLGTLYLTSILDEERLNKIKAPINHNEWGEGFDDDRGYEYSSWFITVDGVTLHIGIDHRGTSISVREQDITSYEKLLNTIKKLIDLTI